MLLTQEKLAEIRAHYARGAKQARLARVYGVTPYIVKRAIQDEHYTPKKVWTETGREQHRQLGRVRRDRGVCSRLTAEDVRGIKARLATGELAVKIAQSYGVSESAVSLIRKGKRWGDVEVQVGAQSLTTPHA